MSKFKKGDRVQVARVCDANSMHGVLAGMIGTVLEDSLIPFVEIDGWKCTTPGYVADLAFFEDDLEPLKEEMAVPTFKAGDVVTIARKVQWEGWVPSMNEYVGQRSTIQSTTIDTDKKVYAVIHGWYFPAEALDPVRDATIDSLSADYRKAQAVHTEALARCAAARQQYSDAEDELNSASDRLEAAGKALLAAVAKQEG